jgi:hypothetical protein
MDQINTLHAGRSSLTIYEIRQRIRVESHICWHPAINGGIRPTPGSDPRRRAAALGRTSPGLLRKSRPVRLHNRAHDIKSRASGTCR